MSADDYVIELVAFVNPANLLGPYRELAASHLGRYVVRYDPRAVRSEDQLVSTDDPDQALGFPTAAKATACWRTEVGIRADGKPNRPLTAYTVTIARRPT